MRIWSEAVSEMMSVICPMHVLLAPDGAIVQVGPTLRKLRPGGTLIGQSFLNVFRVLRPRSVASVEDLLSASVSKISLQFRDAPNTGLKAVIAPIPGEKGALVNLSFGISVLDAVRDYALTSADFSPIDPTIEMLYLVEAKSAAMEASRSLNARLQGAKIAAEEQAFTDTLTGLKNRRALSHVLGRLLAMRRPFALMQLDLDFFKAVNDSYGHAAGDHVLQQVARVLVSETREDDTVARVGGDEFVLVFDRMRDRDRLDALADRLIAGVTAPIPFEGALCRVSASIGSVFYDGAADMDAARLVADADTALYAAKNAGRGRHFLFDPEAGAPKAGGVA